MTDLMYTYVHHWKSSGRYFIEAERVNGISFGRIVRAFGPVDYGEAANPINIRHYLDNQDEGVVKETAAWLDAEI